MKRKQGISLIVLVITIIVMIILAASIVITLSNAGIINKANATLDITNLNEVQQLATLIWSDGYLNNKRGDALKEYVLLEMQDYTDKYDIEVTDGGVIVKRLESSSGGANYELLSAEYFDFEFDEDVKTATLTGVKDEYAVWSYYNGDTSSSSKLPKYIIDKNGNKITELLLPKEVEYNGEIYTITKIGYGTFSYTTTGNYEPAEFTKVFIPESVIEIDGTAFRNMPFVTELELSNGLVNIGYAAFSGMTSLETIVIPSTVKTIGNSAFSNCVNVTSVSIPNGVTEIEGYAFYGCEGVTSIILPDSVTYIGESAFQNMTKVTTLKLSAGLTTISASSFGGLQSLTTVVVPEGVTIIEREAFAYSGKIANIELPEGLTTIGNYAFRECYEATEIRIPSTITSIGYEAFGYAKNVSKIIIPKGIENINATAFVGGEKDVEINYLGTIDEWYAEYANKEWVKNINNPTVKCTNGTACAVCQGGTATCYSQANCTVCNREYGELALCKSENGICIVCGKKISVIESEHYPYETSQNNVVLGTWDYSDATSVDITVTYQTSYTGGGYYTCAYIIEGLDFVSGSSLSGTYRNYLSTTGTISRKYSENSQNRFSGSTKTTKTFKNVSMLTGSVIFYSSTNAMNYYGVSVQVTPNY